MSVDHFQLTIIPEPTLFGYGLVLAGFALSRRSRPNAIQSQRLSLLGIDNQFLLSPGRMPAGRKPFGCRNKDPTWPEDSALGKLRASYSVRLTEFQPL